MTNVATLLFAFILLVVQSTFALLVPWDTLVPNAALIVVIHMGLHDYPMDKGVILSFFIGYLMDAFAGSPIGLFTFVSVAVCLISKLAAVRLFLQSWLFETILAFFLVIVAGAIVLTIRALFDQDFGGLLSHAKIVILRSAATALVAPFVFRGMRKLEQTFAAGEYGVRKPKGF